MQEIHIYSYWGEDALGETMIEQAIAQENARIRPLRRQHDIRGRATNVVLRTQPWAAGLLLAGALAVFPGCVEPPGTDATADGTSDEVPEATVQQALVTDIACTPFENHGGSVFPEGHVSVLGCACKPNFTRAFASASNTGGGSCTVTGWTSNDPTDCRVNVQVNNSGGGVNGTCTVQISEQSHCPHDRCTTGYPLEASCDATAGQICSVDRYCCETAWDSICVQEVRTVGHSLVCDSPPCPHAECTSGSRMPSTCSTPASQICAVDPYCCTTAWDSVCVSEVSGVTGQTCN